jgi:hypothetical protein
MRAAARLPLDNFIKTLTMFEVRRIGILPAIRTEFRNIRIKKIAEESQRQDE